MRGEGLWDNKVMEEIKFLPISWERLETDCFKLAEEIEEAGLGLERIVAISRGGLVVARLFSDFLKLPISSFTIVSYVSVGKTGKPKVVEELGVEIRGERVLLVDEIVDHGTTLTKAQKYLKGFGPKQVWTAVPYIKPWSKVVPDFWRAKTDRWVVFPYEVRETIEDLVKIWRKEGVEKSKMKERFLKLGFARKMVERFLNEV